MTTLTDNAREAIGLLWRYVAAPDGTDIEFRQGSHKETGEPYLICTLGDHTVAMTRTAAAKVVRVAHSTRSEFPDEADAISAGQFGDAIQAALEAMNNG